MKSNSHTDAICFLYFIIYTKPFINFVFLIITITTRMFWNFLHKTKRNYNIINTLNCNA